MIPGFITGIIGALITIVLLHYKAARSAFYQQQFRNFNVVQKFLYYVLFLSVTIFIGFVAFYLIASIFGLIEENASD